jgi:hypothetical protein
MLVCKAMDLSYLRVRHMVWINPANAGPLIMDLKHDPRGGLAVPIEHALQYVNNKTPWACSHR